MSHDSYAVTFVVRSYDSLDTCEDKCLNKLTHKLIFKARSSVVWNKSRTPFALFTDLFHFRFDHFFDFLAIYVVFIYRFLPPFPNV